MESHHGHNLDGSRRDPDGPVRSTERGHQGRHERERPTPSPSPRFRAPSRGRSRGTHGQVARYATRSGHASGGAFRSTRPPTATWSCLWISIVVPSPSKGTSNTHDLWKFLTKTGNASVVASPAWPTVTAFGLHDRGGDRDTEGGRCHRRRLTFTPCVTVRRQPVAVVGTRATTAGTCASTIQAAMTCFVEPARRSPDFSGGGAEPLPVPGVALGTAPALPQPFGGNHEGIHEAQHGRSHPHPRLGSR